MNNESNKEFSEIVEENKIETENNIQNMFLDCLIENNKNITEKYDVIINTYLNINKHENIDEYYKFNGIYIRAMMNLLDKSNHKVKEQLIKNMLLSDLVVSQQKDIIDKQFEINENCEIELYHNKQESINLKSKLKNDKIFMFFCFIILIISIIINILN